MSSLTLTAPFKRIYELYETYLLVSGTVYSFEMRQGGLAYSPPEPDTSICPEDKEMTVELSLRKRGWSVNPDCDLEFDKLLEKFPDMPELVPFILREFL